MFPGQNLINAGLGLGLGALVVLTATTEAASGWRCFLVGGFLLGNLFVLPIGGADMPVVISLLNACTGLAAAGDRLRAGQHGPDHRRDSRRGLGNSAHDHDGPRDGPAAAADALRRVRSSTRGRRCCCAGDGGDVTATADDIAMMLAYAGRVVFVPGYGLAVAQAQHDVRNLGELLEEKGVDVRYAIHPVAGRMPGHMNVLLAEANVSYDELFRDGVDQPRSSRRRTSSWSVVGANDVVNPAARNSPGSPIYGMPILDVDKSQNVVVIKRSMSPGFAGSTTRSSTTRRP